MKYKLLLITLLVSGIGWGQGFEDFTNLPTASSSSYINRSWSGANNVIWTAEGARTDQTLTGKAICFGNSGNRWVISPTYTGGIGVLTFDYVRGFTGTGNRSIEVWVNETKIGSTIIVNNSSSTVMNYNQNLSISGDIILEIRSTGAAQVIIDNIQWTAHSAPTTTTWSGNPGSWSNGDPTSTVDAIIDGDFSTAGNFICKDLTVNAGATLTINAANKLSVMGNLVNNGSIVFKSNNTSTGRFDSYSGDPITGTGTVTMERYIDGKRAFRLLAPGVTTSGTIANNWQQQVFITGSTTGANGFDATTSGAASMFTFENLGWTPISNTDVLNLNAQTGYRILIRGDRTPSILTSQSNGTMNTPITLTATGTMVTGNVSYNTLTGQEYTLVANPYISPIDWATVTKSGVLGTYYAWDPNLGTGNQRGRFVSCDVAGTTSIILDNGSPNTAVDQYIQPGQAFFIQKSVSGVNGSITIKESDKSDTFTDVFRNANTTANSSTIDGKLGINLYESIAYSLGEYPIDGAVAVSGASFNTNTATDDTKKIISHGEQVAFVRENEQLGVEKVNLPQASDELAIATINLVTNKNYVWSVVLQDNFSNEDAYLLDTYTQNYHPLTATNTTVVPFETTADVASTNENRFKIVFQNTTLNTPTFDNQISLYPNPSNGANGFYITNITASAKVALFTVLGQSVPVSTALNGTTLQVKPMHDVAKGIYVVQVIAEDGATKQVKWIVE
jgi:hypothetical protein